LAAISLASETELFIDQLQEGCVTLTFAEGHLAYLHKDAACSADEIRRARADKRMAGALENGRAQLDLFTTTLAGLNCGEGMMKCLYALDSGVSKEQFVSTNPPEEFRRLFGLLRGEAG
jgi:hypothetical protein